VAKKRGSAGAGRAAAKAASAPVSVRKLKAAAVVRGGRPAKGTPGKAVARGRGKPAKKAKAAPVKGKGTPAKGTPGKGKGGGPFAPGTLQVSISNARGAGGSAGRTPGRAPGGRGGVSKPTSRPGGKKGKGTPGRQPAAGAGRGTPKGKGPRRTVGGAVF